MTSNLTEEQTEIFQFARTGHNLLITGQAGTGKSWVVNTIREDCKQRGQNVALVCSSGIACQVYERGIAATAHSYYGLGAADMPSENLIARAVSDKRVRERLHQVDVIIWDEASMSSARMLELANALHHAVADKVMGNDKVPFGGKQMIIVGEFLQLRPVPNTFDSGNFMFTSNVFKHAVPHRFQLTKLLRQSESNKQFLKAVSEIRLGICSEETKTFIGTLSRNLDSQLARIATHIFFKKNAVLMFNRSRVEELEGDYARFDAVFEGKGERMNWPGERSLFLKSNCKIMLVWNKSDDLKNGSMGTFKKVVDDKLLIEFEKVGTVLIERVTWNQRNRQGEIIGSVTQFPVILAYAVTCHKSQGLELPAVVLHSSMEFVPLLVYVAMSRVRSQDTLQVIDFKRSQVLPADKEVIAQCTRETGNYDPTLCCCKRRPEIGETFFEVNEGRSTADEERDIAEYYFDFPIDVDDGMVRAYFQREGLEENLTVAEIFQRLESHESQLSTPPPGYLNLTALLQELRVSSPCTAFSQMVNRAVEALLVPALSTNVKSFVDLMWFHSFLGMENHIIENADDLSIKVGRGDFTTATAKLHELFISPEFSLYTRCLFNTSACTAAQRSVAVDLGTAIFFRFLDHLLQLTKRDCQEEVIEFDVNQMSSVGKAKVRHVGGWAVRKVLEKSRRYVRANLYSENAETMKSVTRHHSICELIEESLVASVAILEKESTCKETLQVTEGRQYRERGLIHIKDAVYRFFMALESNRVRLLNDQAMRREGCNMVEVAYQKLSSSEDLRVKWQECFSEEDARGKEVIISYKVTDAFEYKLVEEYSFIPGFNDICTSLFIGAA